MTQAALSDPWMALDDIGDQDLDHPEAEALTVLTFTLGRQVFAVDVHRVREILDATEIAPLPNAPHDVLGMIDLRGQSIAIVDLASRIGTRMDQADGTGRIVVFEFETGTKTTSLAVPADRVLRVRDIAVDSIEPVPDTLSDWQCDVADGMARTDDGIALILGIDRILAGGTGQPGPFDFG